MTAQAEKIQRNTLMTEYDRGKRKNYVDVIRIVAIIMVIFNHRYTYYGINAESNWLILKSVAAFLCKMGVTLFFMVSGELLLEKDESFKYIVTHRILRIIIVMVVLALMQTMNDFNLANLYKSFLEGLNWYLYAYVGYLLALPFLRKIAKYTSIHEKILYIGIVSLLYMSDVVKILRGNLLFGYFMGYTSIYWSTGRQGLWYLIYPLIGIFIAQLLKSEIQHKKLLQVLVVGSCISMFLSVGLYIRDLNLNGGTNYEMLRQDFIVLPSILTYIAIYKVCKLVKINFFISEISKCTFGVFLLETNTNIKTLWLPVIKFFTIKLQIGDYWSAIAE